MPKHMPQMLSVMTPFPYHIEAGRPVDDALRMMQEHGIRHLPVMIDGAIEEIVSDRDIKRAQLIGLLVVLLNLGNSGKQRLQWAGLCVELVQGRSQ